MNAQNDFRYVHNNAWHEKNLGRTKDERWIYFGKKGMWNRFIGCTRNGES